MGAFSHAKRRAASPRGARVLRVRIGRPQTDSSMTPDAADSLARALCALHETPREVPAFSERYPDLTPEAGYRAARRLHAHRVAQGWTPVGRKIGFTNRSLWPRYGVFESLPLDGLDVVFA